MKIKLIIPENQKHLFIIFILAWACINLLQAVFTDTISDETYYALYGENLNWGYYDHPPMVGLMTYISNILFDGNLSIRFITVVLQIFALALIWKTIDTVQVSASLFFIISASLIMFQAYGFITTPDAPLLFFMALFLFVYKKFIGDKNLYNTVLLAVSMAGMIYSKYHGILIAGFIFLSNPRLFLSYKTYIAGLVTVLLLFPHIYWQFANNFPGFKYHLNDRSDTFEWIYFLEYIPNQLAVFNPLTFGAAAYVIAKRKPADVFERGLYFIIVGVISFFWVSAFRGHVEPHWTVACSVPIIILLYKRSFEDKKLMKYIKKAVAYSVILIFIVRIALVSGLVPDFDGKKATEFRAIQSVAGNLPTVFTSSFQNPSNYHFFTGKESVTLSSVTGRQTQFDVMRKELEYQGKPAFIVTKNDFTNLFDFACEKQGTRNKEQGTRNKEQGTRNKEQGTRNKGIYKLREYTVDNYTFFAYTAESFQSTNHLSIDYKMDTAYIHTGDTLKISYILRNPSNNEINFKHREFPVIICAAYAPNIPKSQWKFINCEPSVPVDILIANSIIEGNVSLIVPYTESGEYKFALTLVSPICASRNSKTVVLYFAGD